MEQNEKKEKYKCDEIPVIFFNFENEKWEAQNKEQAQSNIAAKYRNQLDEEERIKNIKSARSYESRAKRMQQDAKDKKKRITLFPNGVPSIAVIVLLLVVIIILLSMSNIG